MTDQLTRLPFLATVLLLPALVAGQTEAEPEVAEELREYTVEIILFRYADSVSAGSEIFVPDALPEPVASEGGRIRWRQRRAR